MAFEDRCSPQSAPSPPGIPHSPQNSNHHHQHHQHQQPYTTSAAGSPHSPDMSGVVASPQQQQHHHQDRLSPTMHTIKQEPLTVADQAPAPLEQPAAVRFSISNILSDSFGKVAAPTTSPRSSGKITTTGEKKSGLLFRPYDHISRQTPSPVEFQVPAASEQHPHHQHHHAHHHHLLHLQPSHLQLQQQHHLQQQQQQHQHALMQQQAALLDEMRLAQFRIAQHQHEAAVLDFSRAAAAAAAAAAAIRAPVAIPMAQPAQSAQPLLFNTFNMQQAYPKIHEEILNGGGRQHHQPQPQHPQQQQHHQQQHQSLLPPSFARSPPPALSDSSYAKIPPLGNLCKTVSQIGQPSPRPSAASSTCRSPTSSASSASSTVSLTPVKSDAPAPKASNKKSSNAAAAAEAKSTSSAAASAAAASVAQAPLRDSGMESSDDAKSETSSTKDDGTQLWPAWVYCTRYSDRPSSGPRYRKPKVPKDKAQISDEKRPRTAFSSDQLARLKREFIENRYLTERRRQQLSAELGLNEAQIKIWFQNKRAKIKKTSGNKNPLALQLMAQGLYNHSTVPLTKEEEELEMRMNGQIP